MSDLNEFVAYSNELLHGHLTNRHGKHVHFLVSWKNDDYQVHYVRNSKAEKTSWEMMAYAKVN